MTSKAFSAAALAGILILGGLGAASAQGTGGTGTSAPVRGGGNPAADTRAPGATATEAVTNPALVPPGAGPAGTGAPPGTGGTAGGPAALPSSGR